MGSVHSHRQLTLMMAFLLLGAVSAIMQFNPTRKFSVGARKIKEEVVDQPRLDGRVSVRPSCIARCGNCTPCTPVLVSVNMPLEYYPETWKCKCGDKLFDP